MLKEQRVFDQSCLALIKQRKRSVGTDRDGNYCKYRGKGKTRCAVGHLIPDAEYDPLRDIPSYEGGLGNHQVLQLVAENLGVKPEFLRDLQFCHDRATVNFLPQFLGYAKDLADKYHLNKKVLENAYA